MTDPIDQTQLGLGHLGETPDVRDWPIEALYASEGLVAARTFPAAYKVTGMPAVLNQGNTPQCVAFSSAAMKGHQDHIDQREWFDFDESLFFKDIHGTSQGAHVRDAMNQMLNSGYPLDGGNIVATLQHRIAAYFTVPANLDAIKAAIIDFGPVVVTTTWYGSWFRPTAQGVLPAPNFPVGGHAVLAYGWNDRWGLLCRNSWGSQWGVAGDFFMPTQYVQHLTSAWKTVDQVVHPIPYAHTVKVTATDGRLNIREHPNTAAKMVGSYPKGNIVAVSDLEKFGGKYHVNGAARTDWYRTRKGWIARGWTRLEA